MRRIHVLPLLALLTVVACGPPKPLPVEAKAKPPIAARTMVAQVADEPSVSTTSGTVKARLNATLASKVMGRVESVLVREGDSFRKGQTLALLDSRELAAAVEMAAANVNSSAVNVQSARAAALMEAQTSQARIAQAESQVSQAQAALARASAQRDLAVAGPRTQEVEQSRIAVEQAKSNLNIAQLELDRMKRLVEVGAVARRELDLAQNRFELAQGQYDSAVQSEQIAREGSRKQEIRSAEEAVVQAKAAVAQAQAALQQAKAAALQIAVRQRDVDVARARVKEAAASADAARVGLSYARVVAPFDGRVVQRLVDPGSLASPGSPLLAIEGGEYRLETAVPERLLRWVSVGRQVDVDLDALPMPLKGRIVEVVPQGSFETHTFLARVALQFSDGVKSGMYGRARVSTGEARRLMIPRSATWEREGLNYVFVVNAENVARLRLVTLGEASAGRVEALSGLNSGERIVADHPERVSDGDTIEERQS